jgi:hypothetical protein
MPNVSTNPILEITDGTIHVDLLSPSTGISLKDWVQVAPPPKGDGTWVDSPLTEGRKLVARTYGNLVDSFTLAINGVTPDDTINALQALRQILEKATNYWTSSWATTPVYLKKRGSGETNITYAVIVDWRAPADNNPFAQPFFGSPMSVVDDFELSIEHGFWLSNPPGTGSPVTIGYQRTYGGVNYGHAGTTSDEVFISAEDDLGSTYNTNISHVFRFTAIGATFSANLINTAKPWTIIGAAINDIVYFGCTEHPLRSLILDITTPNVDTHGKWQYWDGALWSDLSGSLLTDNTGDGTHFLNVAGVNGLHWRKTGLSRTAINGVTAYWIRLIVTVAGTGVPKQQNREPYTVKWPYVKIDASQISGDLPALSKIRISNHWFGDPSVLINRIIAAIRSTSRGSTFTPYLPVCSTTYFPASSATVTVDGVNMTINALSFSPTGFMGSFNPGTFPVTGWIKWELGTPSHWFGSFRVFVRVNGVSPGKTMTYTLKVGTSNLRADATRLFYQKSVYLAESTSEFYLVDMGVITLPGTQSVGMNLDSLFLQLDVVNGAINPLLRIYNLVLVPLDEWAVDARWNSVKLGFRAPAPEALEIDAISFPKDAPTCLIKVPSTGEVVETWQRAMNGQPILQTGSEQNLYIFPMSMHNYDYNWILDPSIACSVQIEKSQRYFSARGIK